MKTKALLVAGLIFSAGVVSSMAQGTVFSVNAVGFVNVVCPPGFSIICNPLNAATNTVAALFPNGPEGATVFKFNAGTGSFVGTGYAFGAWSTPGLALVPGEGFFFRNPSATTAVTNTFVGNVQQGTLVTPLNAGFTLVGSQVPVSGLVTDPTGLKLPIAEGDSVFTFNNASSSYVGSGFAFGAWGGSGEPQIAVGQGFFVKKAIAASWTNVFSVNQ